MSEKLTRKLDQESPGGHVTGVTRPSRDKLTGELLKIAERASDEARKKGLTEEKLFWFLKERE